MKKKLVTLISFIVALILSVGIFSGCNLITTNIEKDMNQVVAEIKIDGYKGQTEEIYKKDIMIGYMNYGYYYVQSGNYTASQMFDTIMNNLVNNRILVQTAKTKIKESNGTLDDNNWKASDIVKDEKDITDAKYNAILSLDSLIKQYITTETKYQDSAEEKERAVPTGATNAVEELSTESKKAYISKMIAENGEPTTAFKGEVGSDRLVAYNKVLKLFEVNQVLDKDGTYKTGNMFTTYYYNYLLEGNFESIIVEKYEKQLLKDLSKLTYAELENVFTKLYNNQKELYENDEDAYKTALSSATKVAPIVYAKDEYESNYGYVWNLLIGVTDEQKAAIEKIDKTNKTTEQIEGERKAIIESSIVIEDQRSNWVTAGYDCVFIPTPETDDAENIGTVRFINDYTFCGDNGLPFQGKVEWMNKGEYTQATTTDANGNIIVKYSKNGEIDETYKPEYRVISIDKYTGATNILAHLTNLIPILAGTGEINTMNDIVNELLFAFSTDGGSLNSFNGYLIKKNDTNSSYVKEFQKKGEEILNDSEIIQGKCDYVATDFGYHFMYFNKFVEDYQNLNAYCQAVDSKVMDKACDKTGATAEEYFNYLMNNWIDLTEDDMATYLYSIAKTYMESLISDFETELQRTTKNGVTKYESRYADFLG